MYIVFVFLSGQKQSLTLNQFASVLRGKEAVLHYIAAFLYLNIVGVFDIVPQLSAGVGMFLIAAFIILVVMIALLLCFLWSCGAKLGIFPAKIILSIPFVLSNVILVTSLTIFGRALGESVSSHEIVLLAARNVMVTEIFMYIFANYFFENAVAKFRHRNQLETIRPLLVNVFGLSINPNSITHIRSEDAYVHIHTAEKRYYLRGKIRDACALLDHYGFSPHRSYWVNKNHILRMEWSGGVIRKIILSEDIEIPVARTKSGYIKAILRDL